MGCSACAKRAAERAKAENAVAGEVVPAVTAKVAPMEAVVVEKSEPNSGMIKLRYYGGGMTTKGGSGCRSCGGSGTKYTTVTTETIMFASEDAENNFFKRTFTVGHDYWVTPKQAEYLLTLTYKSRAGQIVHKFKQLTTEE